MKDGFRWVFPKKSGVRKKGCVVLALIRWGNELGTRGGQGGVFFVRTLVSIKAW